MGIWESYIVSHCTTVLVLIIRLVIIIYIHDEFLIVITTTTSHSDIFGGLSIGSVLAVCSVGLNTIKISKSLKYRGREGYTYKNSKIMHIYYHTALQRDIQLSETRRKIPLKRIYHL